ncbi:ABC transporter permease [Streptomyces sp. HUAS MG47]|uniref:FtsX-like permease family protein n=1 Tax=Streptomyces solicamelliae TaxID=3231716 RepID=UPI0038783AAB
MARTPGAVAPWVRTRLRVAPWAACAVGVLVLVTALLAAALPRAVDVYETEGLRHAVASAPAAKRVVEVLNEDRTDADEVTPERLAEDYAALLRELPPPVRTLPADSAYGVRTSKRVGALDRWLPKPSKLLPQLTLSTQSGVPRHSTLRAGRFAGGGAEPEAVVTVATAKALRIKPGVVIHVPGDDARPLGIRITGIVEPDDRTSAYWAFEPTLHTPVYASVPRADSPEFYWDAALLLAPEAAEAVQRTTAGSEVYWRLAPASAHLTGRDASALTDVLASLGTGPDLVRLRDLLGEVTSVRTGLDELVGGHAWMRDAISPVVAVAAFGMGTVALVVLAMTGGLFTARRHAELALLRSRGGSLAGIGVRLLGETAVIAVPAAGLGLLAAVLVVGDASARLLPAALAAAGVALVATLALPLRAVYVHRTPRLHGAREDLTEARPSRRRAVAELTLLVLAAGAVAALRRRGTSDAGDHLVSAAPVLVALIAALVLVRLYPLPLRWAARPAARLRGAVGYLSLARAGRSSANSPLPLLALLVALTTAAFGGSVLAGVADARDRAALLTTGADARITSPTGTAPLPAGLDRAVRGSAGVEDALPVHLAYGVPLTPDVRTAENASDERLDDGAGPKYATVLGVDPGPYARLARETGTGAFDAGLLRARDGDRVVPVIASPAVAKRLGREPYEIPSYAGQFEVRVVAVLDRTPAVTETDFLLVDRAALRPLPPTALLVTAGRKGLDGPALRAVVQERAQSFSVRLRQEQRDVYVDSPMQTGAERVYATAIGAGAGYAGLAVLLSLVRSAPERTMLLARLRTMGLTRRQGRRLLGLEALPQALLAAVGGTLVGWATVLLLAPGVDLLRLALAAAPELTTMERVTVEHAVLRADGWSLALPALGVVLLTAGTAGLQAWWSSRSGSIKELRAGDTR